MLTKFPVVTAVVAALSLQGAEARPEPISKRAEHRDLALPPLCGIFVDGLAPNIDAAIRTLRARKGYFVAQTGPSGCTKLACGDVVPNASDTRPSEIVASSEDCIWFCNDRTHEEAFAVLERQDVIADIAEMLKKSCQGYSGAPTNGQVFGKGGWWNVIIGHSSSVPNSVTYTE